MKKLLPALIAIWAMPLALAAGVPATSNPAELKGEVLEVLDAAAYTYLRLKTPAGETWAAVSRAPVKKGSQVTIFDPARMQDFESKSLRRTFPVIYFGSVGVAGGSEAARASLQAPPDGGTNLERIHGGVAKTPFADPVKVAKAEGANARTVAQINAERSALSNKQVRVRGTVVKVTPNVMGTNWVHLRDGSGSAKDDTHDILVTTKDKPKVGDIVVASGIVKTDVNLGSGYVYKVLVEGVSIGR